MERAYGVKVALSWLAQLLDNLIFSDQEHDDQTTSRSPAAVRVLWQRYRSTAEEATVAIYPGDMR